MSWCHIYYITSVILYIYSGYVTASEYYVSASPNGVPCSNTHLPCHNLSYYTDDYASYFTDDTIFYFLEGTHILQGTLEISGVSNITLQGLGHIEQGFHETVMQSTSVIRCSDYNRSGIQFISSTNIVLESLTIANCGFSWNMYYIKVSLFFIDINNVALKWVSVQNGSGIGLYLYNAFDVLIANSTFANNGGLMNDLGNAVIFYDDQVKRLSRVNIVKSNFTLGSGSGMKFLYFSDNKVEVIIEKSKFSYNTAQYGGGVGIFLLDGDSSIEFSNCAIYNNTAYYASGLSALQDSSTSRIHFTNISFYFNKASNKHHKDHSAVLLENIKNVTFDQIDISNHDTTGLLSINSLIMFDGHNTFINNSGINGGGMALYGFSQLLLKQNTNISFANNHASESGGGIFVSQVIDGNDLTICSFKNFPYYNTTAKTMLYFVNNTADVSGDVMYGGKISYCLNFDFDHQFHYPQQTGLSVVSSDPIQVCFCESNRQNCSITNVNITAIPGINVNISLATVGNKDGLTKGVIKLTTSDSSSSTVQTDNTRLNATCTNVTFNLRANPSLNTTQVYVTSEGLISDLSSNDIHYVKVIEVNIESCPIGFPLVNNACSCRSELNTSSITCDINTQIITRDGDMWIGYKNDSDCLIVYPNCPFDYCNDGTVHFKITSPHPQCLLNRSGILCGQCANGLSLMLGTNQCGQCTNNYIALIIPFALAGIALIAFIIALNLTVSVGTINGLIFYANVVKIYEPIFFSEGPIPFLSLFISWLNLDLGIETCFFDGMDSCSKTWLQFIFPGYVWFLLILIIILSQYSSKVVRLVGRQAIPVLATMILLSYTKLIRTVFQALYSNILEVIVIYHCSCSHWLYSFY